MLYEEFIVREVNHKHGTTGDRFPWHSVYYFLESRRGHKACFDLLMYNHQENSDSHMRYEAVAELLLPGVRIWCEIAYRDRGDRFSMGIVLFAAMTGQSQISRDLENPNWGKWETPIEWKNPWGLLELSEV